MKLLVLLFALFFAGCGILSSCVPSEIKVVRTPEGVLGGPDLLDASCVLVASEPYDPWTRFGFAAQVETWECGCDS